MDLFTGNNHKKLWPNKITPILLKLYKSKWHAISQKCRRYKSRLVGEDKTLKIDMAQFIKKGGILK